MRFSRPIALASETGEVLVDTVAGARDFLMGGWPGERGPLHRDALDACLKVLDGHRSTEDAETAFVEALSEAGLLRSA